MGLLSYFFLVYLNSNLLVKITLYSFLILFIYALIIIIINYKKLKLYKKELLFFSNKFDKNTLSLKDIYYILYLDKKYLLSNIFLSGLDKTIYLHKIGINNITVIICIIKNTMDIKMLYEIKRLKKNLYLLLAISNIIFFISIIMFIINVFKFLQELNIIFYNDLPLPIIVSGINELIFHLIVGIMLAFPINIVYYKNLSLLNTLISDYIMVVNKFITFICYKFNNLK